MIPQLIAPIDIPAIQFGCRSASGERFVNAGLIGANRNAAQEQQGDALERHRPRLPSSKEREAAFS
ncbi:MAG: hypothetical protein JWM91_1496 [Rhodospirillales bacterium]|nr:hypothetical protein [Rhodospirillales bacterium]